MIDEVEGYLRKFWQDAPPKAVEFVAKIARRALDAELRADESEIRLERILELLRNTKLQHGTCQPRSRKACTNCNSQEQLDKIISEWKGPKLHLSGADERDRCANLIHELHDAWYYGRDGALSPGQWADKIREENSKP